MRFERDESTDRDSDAYILKKHLAPLPPEVRLAWAVGNCDLVVPLLSPYWQFDQMLGKTLDHVWKTVWGNVDLEEREVLKGLHESLTEERFYELESEYGLSPTTLRRGLLMLCEDPDPMACGFSVDDAATLFAAHNVFRQGVSPTDEVISCDFFEQCKRPVYDRSIEIYEALVNGTLLFDDRKSYLDFPLDNSIWPVPSDVAARITKRPPEREVDHIRELYRKA